MSISKIGLCQNSCAPKQVSFGMSGQEAMKALSKARSACHYPYNLHYEGVSNPKLHKLTQEVAHHFSIKEPTGSPMKDWGKAQAYLNGAKQTIERAKTERPTPGIPSLMIVKDALQQMVGSYK